PLVETEEALALRMQPDGGAAVERAELLGAINWAVALATAAVFGVSRSSVLRALPRAVIFVFFAERDGSIRNTGTRPVVVGIFVIFDPEPVLSCSGRKSARGARGSRLVPVFRIGNGSIGENVQIRLEGVLQPCKK